MRRPIPHLRNFGFVLAVEASWAAGAWLANPSSVMPNFLARLGATPRWIGLLPGLWAVGTGFGALVVGAAASHRRLLARYTGWLHVVATLPWLGLALVARCAGHGTLTPRAALELTLGGLLVFNLLLGFGLQLYFVILSRIFPERMRGRWFGALFAVSSFVGAAGPFAAGRWFIGDAPDSDAYARLFFTTFLAFLVGTIPLFFLTERLAPAQPPRTAAGNLRRLAALTSIRHGLRRYLAVRFVLEIGMLCFAYWTTYARTEGGMSEHETTALGVLVPLSEGLACVLLGSWSAWLERRHGAAGRGFLRVQFGAQALSFAALLAAAVGPARPATVLLAVAAGIRVAADFVIHPNILIEAASRRDRLDAVALGAVTLMPATLAFPGAAGLAIERFGHRPVFVAALVPGLFALAALWRLGARRRRNVLHSAPS